MILHEHIVIKVNEIFIRNLRYADDIIILAGTYHGSSAKNHGTDSIMYSANMDLRWMLIIKYLTDTCNNKIKFILNCAIIERVYLYMYIGTLINSNGNGSKVIKYRIEIVRSTFLGLKKSCDQPRPRCNARTSRSGEYC